MNHDELEKELTALGSRWPAPSVKDKVIARIAREPAPPIRRRGLRVGVWLTAASLLLAAIFAVALTLTRPHTLHAQVVADLNGASAAHITISALDQRGVRSQADIWYSRARGFRVQTPEETTVDDGRQQWTWRTAGAGPDQIVSRRASPGTAEMISGMFSFENAPADWPRQRSSEHDREVAGVECEAFVVQPPPQMTLSDDGLTFVPERHPPRLIVLRDPRQRIVGIEEQRQVDGRWQSGRQIAIEYDAEVRAEKFVADFPAGWRVVDASGVLEERFPLPRALATAEAGGLLFAVHEAFRGADDTWYVVSSVRGTPEYLKSHPPQPRRLNLQTVVLDVAGQVASPGIVNDRMHRAVMASAEMDGVQYLWWLAVRRRQFTVENGVRRPFQYASPSLESEPGRLSLELWANYRGAQASQLPPHVKLAVPLQPAAEVLSFTEMAALVRRDVTRLKAAGAVIGLLGEIKGNVVGHLDIETATDADIVSSMSSQVGWMREFDEVKPIDASTPLSPPAAK
ncbi:MAG TPA: hypothetical protein VFI31_01315 [Pirellulales bacterium]|nr:hypothetical protein [Pirellulales bacterium]